METCSTCGHVIYTQVWVNGRAAVKQGKTVLEEAIPGHWRELDSPYTPMGERHICQKQEKEGV